LLQASNGAVSQAVSKNKNAIGYVGIGYLNNDLKGLTVDGIEGTKATTLSGEFPVSRTLFMFTDGWPKGDTLKFINYVMNPNKGQKFVSEVGYVSIF
jgi:phosphate transport system substrate-binding protein